MWVLDGQGLKTYGFYLIAFLRVQATDILFGVGGEGKKGKASHYLMPQLAVVSGMNIIKTRHSIFNGKNNLGSNSLFGYYLTFTKMLTNYVITMISNA